MIEKLKTAIWFIKQPQLYPQFFQLVKSRVLPIDEKRDKATQWCKERAVSVDDAFQRLTGMTFPNNLQCRFQSEFREAKERIAQYPADRGGPGDMDLLFHLCEYKQATKVIETGVAYGWSSLAILLSLLKRNNSLLVSTDMPYAKMDGDDYVGCVVPDHLKDHWELIRLPDRQGLPKALALSGDIDLCHYDSDKSYEGRRWAYPRLWKALKPGGIFISDDIGDNFAFKDFVEKVDKQAIIIKSYADYNAKKYVGITIK